jgi:HEAT repeat protein
MVPLEGTPGMIRETDKEILIAALKDNEREVRDGAAVVLSAIGWDWEPKDDAQRALRAVALSKWEEAVKLGAAAVEPLIAALKDREKVVRYNAAVMLREIGDARAVAPLIAALKDSDTSVRERAAIALNKIVDMHTIEPLIAALKDKEVWGNAAELLKSLGKQPWNR